MTKDELDSKLINLVAIRSTGATLGALAGLGYAFKKKKGFWAYVGYGLLGSIVLGGITSIATMPMATSLAKEKQAMDGNLMDFPYNKQ